MRLTQSGTLRPAESITYRSPVAGRETEIVFLVPEGTRVGEGDLLARLDTTDLERELERATQELRQAQVELQAAEIERQEAEATLGSLREGEGALGVDEAQATQKRAERKVERLRESYDGLKPLLEKGYITREEADRAAFELEQAEAELQLARRKAEILVHRTHPQEQQRAELQIAQRRIKVENVRRALAEASQRVKSVRQAIDECSLYARRPGLVVYEEYLATSPRRKVRVGDRVTRSQGIVTIPEVNRMIVETSVEETDVHRVRVGQSASIRLDAFPGLLLAGRVAAVGALARSATERPEEKRFDLTVEVDPTDAAELRPEMTARVDVVVAEKTGALLLPVNAVLEDNGVVQVRVLGPWGAELRRVEIGDTDGVWAEVLAGLKEGERVALNDGAAAPAPAPVPGRSLKDVMGGDQGRLGPQ